MNWREGVDGETVDDALELLQDMVLWEMTRQRWDDVDKILERMAATLASRDAAGMRAAIGDLELSGPVRALRIGSFEPTGITGPVLDRQNTLVHALVVERKRQSATADHGESGRGHDSPR